MSEILKAAQVEKQEVSEGELALINRQSLRPLTAEEVYTFRLAACDNQVDRDYERFTDRALEELAPLFVGRPVLLDHKWSAGSQTARVYAAGAPVCARVLRKATPMTMPTTGATSMMDAWMMSGATLAMASPKGMDMNCMGTSTIP